MIPCYCKSEKTYDSCCKPYLLKQEFANNPEQLMRSRYTAYVLQNAEYLIETTHFSERKNYSKTEILNWSKSNTWLKLEVLTTFENLVEFKAYYLDEDLKAQVHHEKSTFKQEDNRWHYLDGEFY